MFPCDFLKVKCFYEIQRPLLRAWQPFVAGSHAEWWGLAYMILYLLLVTFKFLVCFQVVFKAVCTLLSRFEVPYMDKVDW